MSAVIAGYARTPFLRYTGAFATIPAVALGAHAARAALARAGVPAEAVQRVFAGHVLQGLAGQNPARQAAVAAGIPLTAPATTVNAVCLSGLEAVVAGADLIATGRADIVVAIGMESMSLAPHAWHGRTGTRYGTVDMLDTLEHDGLTDAFEHRSMGASTEAGNTALHLDRPVQDAWAARSHQRAAASREFLAGEIAPFTVADRILDTDDGVRPGSTAETLARLRPAFAADGTITAGNSSPLTDGAAAVVLMSAAAAASHGVTPLARVLASAMVAGPDVLLHHQPSYAISTALGRLGAVPSDLTRIEVNEAFAAVAVASTAALGVDPAVVNVHGGAVALGHPIGASGARIVGTLARQLSESGTGGLGAAAICGGGGQGSGVILKAI
ncbi:acetyl-CoA C-acyltransferase [Actinoplanes derwentensis]|uniref:Probable acetyl-CoA acetyltransferase n=1 Tax=Actinoplanes derwentensis TaxID=113562 RepID=A0A1H1XJD3_9ACTN|nr:acetyl-CoA C-acyltransferase [Actinoplanes derwentensis]GID87197.1 acetyl-CoA acetyltransferase [Actinoplanes derwentensis]SDT08949.1 acetyl-CoA acetyltransferase [Actinoplanes derwentensis]